MIKCPNGHKYNNKKHSHCPHCGVNVDLNIVQNFKKNQNDTLRKRQASQDIDAEERTVLSEQQTIMSHETHTGDNPTVMSVVSRDEAKKEEVYLHGWLVAIEGANRNKDYRLNDGNNNFGIDYDGKFNGDSSGKILAMKYFSLEPKGNNLELCVLGTENVYVNGETVVNSCIVTDIDKIKVRGNEFVLQTFKGGIFKW